MLLTWQLSLIFAKFIFNLAGLLAIGSALFRMYFPQVPAEIYQFSRKFTASSSILALLAVLSFFQINVALFSNSGFSGLFNKPIMTTLLWTNLGYSTFARILSLIFMVLSAFQWRLARVCGLLGILIFICSYPLIGHTLAHPHLIAFVLGFHVLSASFWVGSLWPLYQLSKYPDIALVSRLMNRFGQVAIGWIVVLLLTGLTLLIVLLPSPHTLLSTLYGGILLVKISFVLLLLALAAVNKIILVPKISTHPIVNYANKLKNTITIEMLLVLFILIATTFITTMVGPK